MRDSASPVQTPWLPAVRRAAHPVCVRGAVIEAPLGDVKIGELCVIRASLDDRTVLGRAQVIGLGRDTAILALLGAGVGLSRSVVLEPTGERFTLDVSVDLLGKVVDAMGVVRLELAEPADMRGLTRERREVDAAAPDYALRQPVRAPFETGVRLIDGVLACGIGQRVAVLAPAGAGKTSLLIMVATHAVADVIVIALVGERGREAAEMIDALRGTVAARRIVLVCATSDAPSVERSQAAATAMTIAEYFRDQGLHAVLILDSLTRYARALRDVALAAGELPARRGYPASIFERLPQLLERAGNVGGGAITAFCSVLLESEDEADPVGEEVMSILDGHFVLSRKLAGMGQFPAIDIARSVSRVADQVGTQASVERALAVRSAFTRAAELSLLVELGEYKPGVEPRNDMALARVERLNDVFRQSRGDGTSFANTCSRIDDALAQGG
ncbi:MAG: EscN/YscN/HrcN family type III secretion system ATPase [Pararobbsia sp.]